MQSKHLLTWLILGGLLWLATSCRIRDAAPEAGVMPTPVALAQWAISAEASSQFGFPDWSPNRVIGEPQVSACVDDPRAWASARGTGLEWLELYYAEPVYATEVRVYQTFGRGGMARVLVVDEDGLAHLVWEGDDTGPCPGVLAVSFPRTAFRVQRVRLEIDESRQGFWNQIDAVALIGIK